MKKSWKILVCVTAIAVMASAWAGPGKVGPLPLSGKATAASSSSLSYDSQTCSTRAPKLEPLKLVALKGSAYYAFLKASQGPWYKRWFNSTVSFLKRLNPFK